MKNLGKLTILGAVLAGSASLAFASSISLASYGSAALSPYTVSVTGEANTAVQYVGADNGYPTVAALVAAMPSAPTSAQLGTVFTNTTGAGEAAELNPSNGSSNIWDGPLSNSAWVGMNQNSGPVGTYTSASNDPTYGYYLFTTNFTGSAGIYDLSLTLLSDDAVEVFLNDTLVANLTGSNSQYLPGNAVNENVTLLGGTNANQLEFVVLQTGIDTQIGDPSGIDFTGSLTNTPEPSSLMLLGTGLIGVAGMIFRKRVTA